MIIMVKYKKNGNFVIVNIFSLWVYEAAASLIEGVIQQKVYLRLICIEFCHWMMT